MKKIYSADLTQEDRVKLGKTYSYWNELGYNLLYYTPVENIEKTVKELKKIKLEFLVGMKAFFKGKEEIELRAIFVKE